MSRYQDWLINHIKENPDFIRPERYKNEVLAFLRDPLEDLCISRPKKRLKWGITLPFDDKYVTYVWFDALLNYISALGYPDGELFKKFWPVAQHIVAKDILKPHGIYWPIMLKAAGIDIYKHLNVHGYWNIEQSKMSKSLGNVIEPLELKNVYGLDAFRFFLTRDMTFGLDSNFSEAALIHRINSDLANDLGNLFSRTLTMAHKYLDGIVPEVETDIEAELGLELDLLAKQTIVKYATAMDEFAFHHALQSVWDYIARMNKCIDVMAPWELAKKQKNRPQLNAVMVNLLEGLRVVSGLIYPIMPNTAKNMHKHLGLNEEEPFYTLDNLNQWPGMKPGTKLMKTVILFPRIDPQKPIATADQSTNKSGVMSDVKPQISIEDFSKVDLRVATVIRAEAVPRAKKLIKLDIDVGEKRTIVAGVAGSYTPEELVGKQIVVVVNLKPAKIMGILSNGMLLAAVGETGTSIISPNRKMAPGTPLQ
jgi:methionyl-tRNA synthetase